MPLDLQVPSQSHIIRGLHPTRYKFLHPRCYEISSETAPVEFQNGKVCRRVTLFGYRRNFDLFFTAQATENLEKKILCLLGLTGLHSLI